MAYARRHHRHSAWRRCCAARPAAPRASRRPAARRTAPAASPGRRAAAHVADTGQRAVAAGWRRAQRPAAGQHRHGSPPSHRHRPANRDTAGSTPRSGASAPRQQVQLMPPKPKELLITRRTGAADIRGQTRAHGTSDRTAVTPRQPGMKPWRMHSAAITASTMPDAPSVCPVQPLVELHGTSPPNTATSGEVLHRVIRLGAGAVQIHVVDIAAGANPAPCQVRRAWRRWRPRRADAAADI